MEELLLGALKEREGADTPDWRVEGALKLREGVLLLLLPEPTLDPPLLLLPEPTLEPLGRESRPKVLDGVWLGLMVPRVTLSAPLGLTSMALFLTDGVLSGRPKFLPLLTLPLPLLPLRLLPLPKPGLRPLPFCMLLPGPLPPWPLRILSLLCPLPPWPLLPCPLLPKPRP